MSPASPSGGVRWRGGRSGNLSGTDPTIRRLSGRRLWKRKRASQTRAGNGFQEQVQPCMQSDAAVTRATQVGTNLQCSQHWRQINVQGAFDHRSLSV